MSIDIEKLAQRVAALESRIAVDEPKKDEEKDDEKKEAGQRETLAAEIEALESRLNVTAADEKDDEKDDEKKASLVDPNGVEEQISQKSLTEVEDLEHGTELATGDSMLDVAPTEYVARMKSASARLDKVADYLEKSGRVQLAGRVDKIADAIDAKVAKVVSKA
jgi:BMFP domain-containing protein YqiC